MKQYTTALIILVMTLIMNTGYLRAGIIHVPADYGTIQAGVDAAAVGDTVLLADGLYSGPGNRDVSIQTKCITVQSENGVYFCVLDCDGSDLEPHRAFRVTGCTGGSTLFRGLTIRNGYAANGTPDNEGGGIFISNSEVTVMDCIFSFNDSINGNGGGLACADSNVSLVNCRFFKNNALFGGALGCLNSDLVVQGSSFMENNVSGGNGGAVECVGSRLKMDDCTISGNTVLGTGSRGGGLYCDTTEIIVSNSVISRNKAVDNGGGLYVTGGSVSLVQVEFAGNRTSGNGGGAAMFDTDADILFSQFKLNASGTGETFGGGLYISDSGLRITGSLINSNSAGTGGGICLDNSAGTGMEINVQNCTLAGNSASSNSVYCRNLMVEPEMRDSIFWGNGGEEIGSNNSILPVITYSDIRGGYAGSGNIDADPLFVDGAYHSYYISQTAADQATDSPCLDSGSSPASSICVDVSGSQVCMDQLTTRSDAQPDAGTVDMGCHAMFPQNGMDLILENVIMGSGDWFDLRYYLHNSGSEGYTADVFIILDIFGYYAMYPSWRDIREGIDYKAGVDVPPGNFSYGEDVLRFQWPAGTGTTVGILFYGAAFETGTYNIIGDLQVIHWGFN